MDQAAQQPTNLTPQIQPIQTAQAQSPMTSTPPAGSPKKSESHKLLFVIAGIVLLLAILGGATFMLLENQSTTEVSQVQIQSTKPRVKAKPTAMPIEGTVEEVEAIDVGENTDDTAELQVDVNQL